ncbi:MAG: hypothetical protein GX175_10660, partial [Halanaerobiaceae bacterium]|nr:hypothetical protein [Halanaerobiaceae bacterium]
MKIEVFQMDKERVYFPTIGIIKIQEKKGVERESISARISGVLMTGYGVIEILNKTSENSWSFLKKVTEEYNNKQEVLKT